MQSIRATCDAADPARDPATVKPADVRIVMPFWQAVKLGIAAALGVFLMGLLVGLVYLFLVLPAIVTGVLHWFR